MITTDAYNNKIYNKLQNNTIQDKILNGTLEESECDSKEVYNFLKLLRKPSHNYNQVLYNEIIVKEWINVVKKAKKRSILSIFFLGHMQSINVH